MTIRSYINAKQSEAVATPRGRRPGDRPQGELCNVFFMELYNSAAEGLAKPVRGGAGDQMPSIGLQSKAQRRISTSMIILG